ncbi:MAG TPA: hypothetical protein VFA20_00860 [Myxococcaceae bacterium]|nr:hypothetical protein [Myxococcaceae bacterium]
MKARLVALLLGAAVPAFAGAPNYDAFSDATGHISAGMAVSENDLEFHQSGLEDAAREQRR